MKADFWANKKIIIPLALILFAAFMLPILTDKKVSTEIAGTNGTEKHFDNEAAENAKDRTIDPQTDDAIKEASHSAGGEEQQNVQNNVAPAKQPKQDAKSVTESASKQKEPDVGESTSGLSEAAAERLFQEINDSYQATVEEINRTCDNDIAAIKAETQEEISDVNSYYQALMRELASNMRKRGLYDSGIHEGEKAKLAREWDRTIEKILIEQDRRIEEVENFRRSQIGEAEQRRDALIHEVLAIGG